MLHGRAQLLIECTMSMLFYQANLGESRQYHNSDTYTPKYTSDSHVHSKTRTPDTFSTTAALIVIQMPSRSCYKDVVDHPPAGGPDLHWRGWSCRLSYSYDVARANLMPRTSIVADMLPRNRALLPAAALSLLLPCVGAASVRKHKPP